MDTRKIILIATIAVIALAAVGIGYAYNAFSVNDGNQMTTEYAELLQTNYNFAAEDKDDTFNTKTATQNAGPHNPSTNPLVTTFKLNNTTRITGSSDGASNYYGVAVGSPDTLKVDQINGTQSRNYTVTVTELSGFKDFSGSLAYWKYVIKVTDTTTTQYVVFNGSTTVNSTNVTYIDNTGATATSLTLVEGTQYTTTLYFAGLGVQNLIGETDATAWGAQSTQIATESTGAIITNGSITFKAEPSA